MVDKYIYRLKYAGDSYRLSAEAAERLWSGEFTVGYHDLELYGGTSVIHVLITHSTPLILKREDNPEVYYDK